MRPPSLARNFFEQIQSRSDPVAYIRGLINSTPLNFETDWLDFKQQPSVNLKDSKWREIWVEALSGFANNQGGVIIWGIDARKDPATNIDAASSEKPVNNPSGVKSRLVELQRQATDPPLANVEIDTYEILSTPGTGFVVCFVPDGPFKPYRAEDGRRSQYYVRAGDNFVVMPRSMIQTMFYPRMLPRFSAEARLVAATNEDSKSGKFTMECFVRVCNNGTATAQDAVILLSANVQGKTDLEACRPAWEHIPADHAFALQSTHAVHPEFASDVCRLKWEATPRSVGDRMMPAIGSLKVSLTIYSRDMNAQRIIIPFDDDLFLTGYAHWQKGEAQIE